MKKIIVNGRNVRIKAVSDYGEGEIGIMNKKEKLSEIMKLNSTVRLKDGRKGKVIGQLANGEYLLGSGKGGQITYFKAEDIEVTDE